MKKCKDSDDLAKAMNELKINQKDTKVSKKSRRVNQKKTNKNDVNNTQKLDIDGLEKLFQKLDIKNLNDENLSLDKLNIEPVRKSRAVRVKVQESNQDTPKTEASSDNKLRDAETDKSLNLSKIPQNLGDNEDEIPFRNDFDRKFIFDDAPKIMKRMIYKRKNWTPFHDDLKEKHSSQFIAKYYQNRPQNEEEFVQEQFEKLMKDKSFKMSFPSTYDQEWLKRCLRRPISESD